MTFSTVPLAVEIKSGNFSPMGSDLEEGQAPEITMDKSGLEADITSSTDPLLVNFFLSFLRPLYIQNSGQETDGKI